MTMGYAVYAADRVVLSSVLAPMSSSLAITNVPDLGSSAIGWLSAAQFIGVTCTVFAAGYLSDRYGRWPVIICGLTVFTAFTWLIGLSSNFFEAFAFRLISGFGEGAFWPVAMASVATYFKGRKGLGLGIFYVGFDAGSVAGLSIGGVAYSLSASWRPAFFFAPLLGLVVIAGALIVRRKLPGAGQGSGAISLGRDALQLLKKRNVVLIMAFALLATWSSVWQVAFLPYYFYKVLHFNILSSALLSSLVTISGGFGKVILGGVSDSVQAEQAPRPGHIGNVRFLRPLLCVPRLCFGPGGGSFHGFLQFVDISDNAGSDVRQQRWDDGERSRSQHLVAVRGDDILSTNRRVAVHHRGGQSGGAGCDDPHLSGVCRGPLSPRAAKGERVADVQIPVPAFQKNRRPDDLWDGRFDCCSPVTGVAPLRLCCRGAYRSFGIVLTALGASSSPSSIAL